MFPSPLEQRVSLCLFKYSDVNCRDNGHRNDRCTCETTQPASLRQGIWVCVFQHLQRSQGLGAKWIYVGLWHGLNDGQLHHAQMKDGMCKGSCLELRTKAEMMSHLIDLKWLHVNCRGGKHLSYSRFYWRSCWPTSFLLLWNGQCEEKLKHVLFKQTKPHLRHPLGSSEPIWCTGPATGVQMLAIIKKTKNRCRNWEVEPESLAYTVVKSYNLIVNVYLWHMLL